MQRPLAPAVLALLLVAVMVTAGAVIAQEVDELAALIDAGRAHFEAGDYQTAETEFSQALGKDPQSAEALCGLGAVCLRQGRIEEAGTLLQRAVALNPNLPAARNDLGVYFLQTGPPARAAQQFQAAVTLEPDSAAARFNLGLACLAAEQWQEALDALNAAKARGLDSADLHHALGRALLGAGKPAEAAPELEAAVERAPDKASLLVALARARLQMGETLKAVEALRQAIALDPRSRAAWEELPAALAALGPPAETLASLEQKASEASEDIVAQLECGLFALNQKALDVAERCLTRATELNGENPVAWVALGWTYVLQSRWEQAAPALEKAAVATPDDPAVLINLALAYFHTSKEAQYEATLRRLLEVDKYNSEAAYSLGALLESRQEWDGAALAFGRAATSRETPEALLRLGHCLIEGGRAGEALGPLNRAETLRPDSPATLFDLGRALEALGQKERALRVYKRALELKPDYVEAQQRIAALEAK